MNHLAAFRERFNPLFDEYLAAQFDRAPGAPLFASMKQQLLALSSNGKRIRPFVAQAAYEAAGGTGGAVLLPLQLALELYHLFGLVHDDIVDGAAVRHDVRCMHTEFGVNQGILAGDLVSAWAYGALLSYGDMPRVMEIFSLLAAETVIGQMIDVALTERAVPFALLDARDEMKTSRYTFIYPALLGRAVANAHAADDEAYRGIGSDLGSAYQRLDDLADALYTEEQLGKEPCSDIAAGIPTHLSQRIMDEGTPGEKTLLARAFGAGSLDDRDALQQMVRSSAAVAEERRTVDGCLVRASAALALLGMPKGAREKWQECITLLRQRLETL